MEKTTTGALARPRKPVNKSGVSTSQSTINGRNLGRVDMKDLYNVDFSLFDSSSTKQDAIWFKIESGPRTSLHLSKENATALVEVLNRFIENGTIK
jgi:hypothetical protein